MRGCRKGDLLGSFSLRKFCLRMCVFCGVFFVVQARMETSAHLCRERTCGETEPASSSWAEPESYPTRGSRRPIYFDCLSSMRRTNFHSSSSTSTFFPGHRLSPMRIPNRGHETFDIKCGRVHPWPGHVHFQAFLSRKTFIIFFCLA